MVILFIVFGLGIPVALVVIACLRASTNRWTGVWAETGRPYGLTFSRNELSDGTAGGTLRGKARGREVVVRSKTGRHSHTVTVNVLNVKTGRFQLDLTPERLVARLEKLLGAEELETGDPSFDRAFYLHTKHPGRCVAALDKTVRAGLLKARPDAVNVGKQQVQICFSGFGRWHRRPINALPALLQGAIETALNLAESVESAKPVPVKTGRTHRPLLAKAVSPLLMVLTLGALWLGANYVEHYMSQRRHDRLVAMDRKAELTVLPYKLLSVASERAHNAEQEAMFGKYADSPDMQRILRKTGIKSNDEAARAQTQRTLNELRTEIDRVLEQADEPTQARQTLHDETLAKARDLGVPHDQIERLLAELGVD